MIELALARLGLAAESPVRTGPAAPPFLADAPCGGAMASLSTSKVRRLSDSRRIDAGQLDRILAYVAAGAAHKIDRRKLLRDLGRAKAYYNTRLDFDRNKRQLASLTGAIVEIGKCSNRLASLLEEDDVLGTVFELRMSRLNGAEAKMKFEGHEMMPIASLQYTLKVLAARAVDAQLAINKRSNYLHLRWSHNAELIAKLAVVFEDHFGKPAGYARAQEESAPANTFIRFVNAVFERFELPKRSLGSIANDLTKVAPRISALKAARLGTKN
jgi:hypothetical protein